MSASATQGGHNYRLEWHIRSLVQPLTFIQCKKNRHFKNILITFIVDTGTVIILLQRSSASSAFFAKIIH